MALARARRVVDLVERDAHVAYAERLALGQLQLGIATPAAQDGEGGELVPTETRPLDHALRDAATLPRLDHHRFDGLGAVARIVGTADGLEARRITLEGAHGKELRHAGIARSL